METELKSLRIDRTARRDSESKPILKLILLAVVLGLLAVGGVFASVAVFTVFILALLAKPQGLFGTTGARRV